ncbi:probable nose resistant to fluoxetine protein 6 at N-terminal half [Coccomyxa sp. Obi]|nr:probable nose resistant to fluoxetine protein 6 at N-terminal half [Coccomyxa sp. Obi]
MGKPRALALSLAPTAGIRALSCVGVVLGHVIYFASLAHEDKADLYKGYTAHKWMNLMLHNAEPSMDAFLVLTGFLAALSLIPALEASADFQGTIYRYYKKRLIRIVPAYYGVLIFLHMYVLPQSFNSHISSETWRTFFDRKQPWDTAVCQKKAWTNFLFTNNQLANGGCFNTSWSLAVQMQFYAVLPLALVMLKPRTPGFRDRVWNAGATVVALTLVYRSVLFAANRLWQYMPIPMFGPFSPQTEPVIDFFARYFYLSFIARLCPMCLGILTALAVTNPRGHNLITRHSGKLLVATVAVFLMMMGGSAEQKIGLEHDPAHPTADPVILGGAIIVQMGLISPLLTVFTLLLTTTGQAGLPKRLADALSNPLLARVADLSYDIYLVHPLVIFGVWSVLPPSTWFFFNNPIPFALVACLVLALSAAAAWVQGKFWDVAMKTFGQKWGASNGEKVEMHARAGKAE